MNITFIHYPALELNLQPPDELILPINLFSTVLYYADLLEN